MFTATYVYADSRGLIGLTMGENEIANDLFNNQNAHTNALGRLGTERRHQFKLAGSWLGPWNINISSYFRYWSGQRYTRTIASGDLGLDLEQGDEEIFVETKGSHGLPNQFLLDFRLEKAFNLPNNIGRLGILIDLFNVFNANDATAVRSISSNENYILGDATAIIAPRLIRLGIKFMF